MLEYLRDGEGGGGQRERETGGKEGRTVCWLLNVQATC